MKYGQFSERISSARKSHLEEDEFFTSYSDLVTLLLTFFIVLVAISEIDVVQLDRVAASLSGAVAGKQMDKSVSMKELFKQVSQIVNQENLQGQVFVERRSSGIVVRFNSRVLFDVGEAQLKPGAFPVLKKLAKQIRKVPYQIVVEGHTDDLPINTLQYPSNWELSAARASEVVKYFISLGVPPNRLVATGMADTHPRAPNRDKSGNPIPENRALNRRVEILFMAKRL